MKNIILIGYMGAGKASVGKVLARRLGMQFYDLDWYIEERFRKKICDLFPEKGAEGFRRIEYNLLHEVAEFEDVVISCGGGTPCFFDNMQYMNARGETVYLKATPDVLFQHLQMGKSVPPLLLNKTPDEVRTFIGEQIKQREPFYTQARHTLDVTLLDNYEKIAISVEKLKKLIK